MATRKFSDELKKMMDKRGITYPAEHVSNAVGRNLGEVQSWFDGHRIPSVKTIRRLPVTNVEQRQLLNAALRDRSTRALEHVESSQE